MIPAAPTAKFRCSFAVLAALAASCPIWGAGPGRAATLTTLHAFQGTKDGANPEGGLIIDRDEVLYGTTDIGGGGARNAGVIFSLTPAAGTGGKWAFKVLYRFTGGSDGGYPVGLNMDRKGNLFGHTSDGFGTVFELEKPTVAGKHWRLQTLYVFSGGADGAYPNDVAVQTDGSVIGTTSAGGIGPCADSSEDPPAGCGVVFQLTAPETTGTPWRETLLHSFARGDDGAIPIGAPIAVGNTLLGAALQGGTGDCVDSGTGTVAGCGVVYRLTPDGQGGWMETVPYKFPGGADGAGPFERFATDRNGAVYGVTAFGGDTTGDPNGNGIVYQLVQADGSFTLNVVHRFTNGADGSHPEGRLIATPGGKLFGTTEFGPSGYHGTVFSLAQHPAGSGAWVEDILARFALPGGDYVIGQIARDRTGAIYGVTYSGGKFDKGTVFQLQ